MGQSIEDESLTEFGRFAQSVSTMDDVDLVIPHQANIRIINAMAEALNIPPEKLYTNVHKYGYWLGEE